jgi:hypothetical protein
LCVVLQVKPPSNVLLAHAVLMLLAFGVLLPTGLLLARHKWLFVDEEEVRAATSSWLIRRCGGCAVLFCVHGVALCSCRAAADRLQAKAWHMHVRLPPC